ncbi:MAG: WhiB family transcriptional regulator [Acidimicrobiia bacterium]
MTSSRSAARGHQFDRRSSGLREGRQMIDYKGPDPYAWMSDAPCRSMSTAFFPSDGVGVAAAQQTCAGCGLRAVCLEFALTHRIEHGVWGGASERERRRVLQHRRSRARHRHV